MQFKTAIIYKAIIKIIFTLHKQCYLKSLFGMTWKSSAKSFINNSQFSSNLNSFIPYNSIIIYLEYIILTKKTNTI